MAVVVFVVYSDIVAATSCESATNVVKLIIIATDAVIATSFRIVAEIVVVVLATAN